jgi:hypothetical protein
MISYYGIYFTHLEMVTSYHLKVQTVLKIKVLFVSINHFKVLLKESQYILMKEPIIAYIQNYF